jgi:hypothetical protein
MENQKIIELFAESALSETVKWKSLITKQHCPFTGKKCVKVRKSEPAVSIGTCTVAYGKNRQALSFVRTG